MTAVRIASVSAWLLFAQLPYSVSAQSECELDGKRFDHFDERTRAGKSGMLVCRDPSTGALTSEEELQNGKLQGRVRTYEAGVLRSEYTLDAEGRKSGAVRTYSATKPKNQLLRDERIEDGWRVGRTKVYYPNGQLQSVAAYARPSRIPIAQVDFTKQGKLSAVRCADQPVFGLDFDDNTLCGHAQANPVDLFDEEGRRRERVVLSRGQKIESSTFWPDGTLRTQERRTDSERITRRYSEQGTKLSESRTPLSEESSVPSSAREFYQDGSPKAEQRWEGGRLVLERSFFMNGQPKLLREVATWNARPVRRETSYHDDGSLASETLWSVDGIVPVGIHKYYDERGKLRSEDHYGNSGEIVRGRRFDASGRVLSDEQVFADGSRKRHSPPRAD